MKTILIAMLLLAAPLMAAKKKKTPTPEPTPVVTLATTPAPLAEPWDVVTLKDGQKADGKVRGYDAFFLEFETKGAKKIQLPWAELAEVKQAELSGDAAMMRQYIKPGSAEVKSRIEAKSASKAFGKALYPGFIIHGAGFREAGNTDMFLSLAGAELFGVLVGGFGATRTTDPGLSQGERDTANYMVLGGAAVFGLTWLIDLVGAPISANSLNHEHGLTLGSELRPGGGALTASLSF